MHQITHDERRTLILDAECSEDLSKVNLPFFAVIRLVMVCISLQWFAQNTPLEVLDIQLIAPWLFAQHEQYLVKQLKDFSASIRSNEAGGMNDLEFLLRPAVAQATKLSRVAVVLQVIKTLSSGSLCPQTSQSLARRSQASESAPSAEKCYSIEIQGHP